MVNDVQRLAREIARAQRTTRALAFAPPQLEHSTVMVDGQHVPVSEAVRTALDATAASAEARTLADRAITDLATARQILEDADEALAGQISDAAKTALLEEIATAGGDLDPAVADALWTDFVIARFLVATDRIVTKDVIADGAIIARHLAIAAEDALTGTTLTLTPDGLRIMASEGGDPLVALTASGLLGLHLRGSSGAVSTSVTGTGIATPALSTGAISLAGEDLATTLSSRSRIVAYGYAESSTLADIDWSETRLVHIGFQAEAQRVYRLSCSAFTLAAKGTPAASQQIRSHMRVRHTLNGSEPTVSSPILWEALNGSQGIRRMTMTPDGLLMRFGANTTVRLIVTAEASDYGQNVVGGPIHFAIYDEGPMLAASGGPISAGRVSNGTNPGTPPAPPKTEHRKLYSPTWTRSYTGNGAHYQWPKDRGFLVQGTMPGTSNGITKSQWGYGTGPAADLAGVPLADILSVRVWLDVPWTYASGGGAIRLNHHGQLADPGGGPYPGLGVHIGDHAVTRG